MGTLARPLWRVGQVLRPAHLLASEEALSAEAARRVRALGLPGYGVAHLDWNGEDPKGGTLFVEAIEAVFPGGAVVSVPDNARVRAPLDLGGVGRSPFEVYLHIVDPPDDPDEEEDPLAEPEGAEVPRREHLLELTAEPRVTGSRDRILLGRFALAKTGGFSLAEDVLPPLLSADAAPSIWRRLEKLGADLDAIQRKLDALAADAVGKDRPLAAVQRVRIEANKLDALLRDLRQGAGLHPYWVFSAVRSFSAELSVLEETKAPPRLPAYDHDRPFPSFKAVFDLVSAWADWAPPSSPRVPFVAENGKMVATLPDDALAAPEVYVVVLKRDEAEVVPFDRVRLASPGRLRVVREYALRGVPFRKDPAPAFRYGFGATAEFYRVGAAPAAPGQDAGEWAHVLAERGLAFHPTPELEGQRFVLCWRRP